MTFKAGLCSYASGSMIPLCGLPFSSPPKPQNPVQLPANAQQHMAEAALWLIPLTMLSTNHSGGAWG